MSFCGEGALSGSVCCQEWLNANRDFVGESVFLCRFRAEFIASGRRVVSFWKWETKKFELWRKNSFVELFLNICFKLFEIILAYFLLIHFFSTQFLLIISINLSLS